MLRGQRLCLCFCLFLALVLLPSARLVAGELSLESEATLSFVADLSKPTTEWKHYWSECVGSGHALLALRQDYREHLAMVSKELGMRYVRFHAIFDDDMSTYLNGGYSFFNLYSIYDFLLSINMKPYVELSFMPEDLASGSTTIFHYKGNTSPPKSYDAWGWLIGNFTAHLVARYGVNEIRKWYFEVWNEPNLGFWNGTQADYFKLYRYSVNAIKAVDPFIRVGGPATSNSSWISDFKRFITTSGLPCDFISTHLYPTDRIPLQRDIMYKVISQVKQEASPWPVYYSEYNSGLFWPGLHDDPYASAFVMYNIQRMQGLLDLMSYWTFSDIFEEGGFESEPFHEGFGMLTIHRVPKPAYRAFQLLHRTGTERVYVGPTNYTTAGLFAILNKRQNELMIIVYNHNIPQSPINTETISLVIKGISSSSSTGLARMERIDETHCNAKAKWIGMGKPTYLDGRQVTELLKASQFVPQELKYNVSGQQQLTFEPFTVPPQGVVAITLKL